MKARLLLIGNFLSRHRGTTSTSEVLSELLKAKNWTVITSSSNPNRIIKAIDMCWTIWQERNNYDIAHVDVFSGYGFIWAELAGSLLKILGKPFILTFRALSILDYIDRWPKRIRLLMLKANRVMTPSRVLQGELNRFRQDIGYLPIGVNLQHYDFKLRIQPKAQTCWLRAFGPMTNPKMAIEAVDFLKVDFPEIHLTMFGPILENREYDAVNELIKDKDLSSNVDLPGLIPKADVPTQLNKSDIFINTTNYESFGVAVMEAAALGLTIVTTDAGELPYMWANGEDALVVPVGDANAMSLAIKRILTEPGLAEKLSRNARQKAEQYDWSAILPLWENLFAEVLENHKN